VHGKEKNIMAEAETREGVKKRMEEERRKKMKNDIFQNMFAHMRNIPGTNFNPAQLHANIQNQTPEGFYALLGRFLNRPNALHPSKNNKQLWGSIDEICEHLRVPRIGDAAFDGTKTGDELQQEFEKVKQRLEQASKDPNFVQQFFANARSVLQNVQTEAPLSLVQGRRKRVDELFNIYDAGVKQKYQSLMYQQGPQYIGAMLHELFKFLLIELMVMVNPELNQTNNPLKKNRLLL